MESKMILNQAYEKKPPLDYYHDILLRDIL